MIKLLTILFLFLATLFFFGCKRELSCEGCIEKNQPALAVAGPDTVITLPTDSVLLDGSASSDPDGTITSYKWAKIAGPVSANIIKPDSAKTLVKSLVAGVYQFELTVTDNGGLSAKDTVQVLVDKPGVNQPPVACAGADQVITLPANTINFDGSCSADPDNNISSYAWLKISGPISFTIANSNAAQTQVTNLVEGIYLFELTITDAGRLSSKDTMQVIVIPYSVCDISGRQVVNATLTEIGTLSEPRIPAIGAAGSKIVFAGGVKASICDEWDLSSSAVDIYDINTHVWTTSTLSKERSRIAAVSSGNKIFFAGGVNWDNPGNVSYDNVDIYDVLTNIWSVAHLSKAREGVCAVAIGNKVIFAGGTYFTGNPNPNPPNRGWDVTDVVDIYDLSTNSWSTAKLSVARAGITPVVLGDKAYFAGGTGYFTTSNAVDIYNSSTNTWSTSNLPEDIALISGYQLANYITWRKNDKVKIKNTSNGTVIDTCVSGNGLRTIGLKNDGIVFFTGYNSTNSALTQFDFYNTLTGTWSIGKVNQNIAGTAAASIITVNNILYLAGGVSYNDCNITYYNKVYTLSW